MDKYQSPSLSMIPLYRSEGDPTRVVMDWKQAGIRIEHDLLQEGFGVKVFTLEEKEEQVIFGIIVSEDRFSMPYYQEVFGNILENLAERDNFTLTPSPDGTKAFYLSLNKEQVEVLELRTALESHEILSSPSQLTIPVGRAFSDTVESLDLRFFSCFYMMDIQDYTPGMTDVLLTGFLFRTNPKNLRFLLLDQGHVLESFYDLPYMFDPPTRTMSGCLQVIRWIQDEIILRLGAMEAKGARSLDGYNASLRVDEQAYTRLLVVITPADELFQNQEFLTVLRMVREHGLMVGIHFFMQMSTPVPITFLTKTTLCFKRAIDAETAKHRLVKNYQIKRGEHTPHFVNACYIEQSDIDTITSYLKENNQLKYMNLVKVHEEEPEQVSETSDRDRTEDLLNASLDQSSAAALSPEEPQEPVSESPSALWARPASLIHIPKNPGVASKEPLKELRRRRVTGYIARFERIVRTGEINHVFRSKKRLRKKTIYRKKTILEAYAETQAPTPKRPRSEQPAAPVTAGVNVSRNYTETAASNTPARPEAPVTVPAKPADQVNAQTAPESTQRKTEPDTKPAGSEASRRKIRKPILPILLGCSLLVGGTYAILRQHNIIQPVTSYIPALNGIFSAADKDTSPAPMTAETPAVAPATMTPDKATPAPTSAPAAAATEAPAISGPNTLSVSGTTGSPADVRGKPERTPAPTGIATAVPTQEPAKPTAAPANTMTPVPTQTAVPSVTATAAAATATPARNTAVPTETPMSTVRPEETRATTIDSTDALSNKSIRIITMTAATASPTTEPTSTPKPTATVVPTSTPKPTATAAPTSTPKPTATDAPTSTPKPTATAAPTSTPKPTATAAPTTAPKQATAVPTATPEQKASAPTVILTAIPAQSPKAKGAESTENVLPGSTEAPEKPEEEAGTEESAASTLPVTVLWGDDTLTDKGASSTEVSELSEMGDLETESGNSGKGQSSVVQNAAQDAADMLMSRLPAGFKTRYVVGDKGEDVVLIKKRMMEMGYYSGSTFFNDRYNDYMASHVRTLQSRNNLPVTGEIGIPELMLLFGQEENR